MIVENTSLTGTKIIRPNVFDDFRGYFFESFKSTDFAEWVANELEVGPAQNSLSCDWDQSPWSVCSRG